MKKSIMRKLMIVTLLAAACCLSLVITGCGGSSEESADQAAEETAAEETTVEETKAKAADPTEVKDAFSAYLKYLEDNAADIEAYEQSDTASQFSSGKDRPVSFFDLDGNGVPEMFVMKIDRGGQDSMGGTATMSIQTFENGRLQEVPYNIRLGSSDSGVIADINVIAGGFCEYAVYSGKDGQIYLYNTTNNESTYSCLTIAKAVDSEIGCDLETAAQITGEEHPDYEGADSDRFTENGKELTAEEAKSKLNEAFSQIDKMSIYGASTFDGEYSTDISLWKQLDPDKALNMTCQSAIAYAGEQSK